MVVASVKASALRLVAIVFALALLVGAALWPGRGIVAVWDGPSYQGVSDNAKRVAFLQQFGWKVNPAPTEVVEIVIPQTFDQVYQNYNEIQKKQGLDLTPYRGARVKRWTYQITNYPHYDGDVYADLLIQDNNMVIAGDVRTIAVAGFIHGLSMPNPQTGAANYKPASADITKGLFRNRAV